MPNIELMPGGLHLSGVNVIAALIATTLRTAIYNPIPFSNGVASMITKICNWRKVDLKHGNILLWFEKYLSEDKEIGVFLQAKFIQNRNEEKKSKIKCKPHQASA
jgi:hypothetical protein